MSRVHKSLWMWLTVWVFLLALSKHQIDRRFEWRYPPLDALVVNENYTTDLSLLLLGAHRLAADVAYIQFLQYYGVDEHSEEEKSHPIEEGAYPRLLEFGRRIMLLDPYFNSGVLEVGGSLAFNQRRSAEALDLLSAAAMLDPGFYRYRLYMAAILYRNDGLDDRLISTLAEAVKYNDCPFMFKNILANLYKKRGRYQEAYLLRLEMLKTAPSVSDKDTAERKLAELLQEHPELQGR